jgi:hypothetical protein
MINTNFRLYDCFSFGEENAYGEKAIDFSTPKRQVKMSINISSQSTQDNILFKDCTYVGVTHDKLIDDSYVIAYGNEKLKVLYVNPNGRYNIVFLQGM